MRGRGWRVGSGLMGGRDGGEGGDLRGREWVCKGVALRVEGGKGIERRGI